MSPFDEGVLAAETAMSRDQNPYKRGTAAYSDWNAGYDFGKDADEATKLDHDWPGRVRVALPNNPKASPARRARGAAAAAFRG